MKKHRKILIHDGKKSLKVYKKTFIPDNQVSNDWFENIRERRFKETHLALHNRPPWSQRNSHWDPQGWDRCPHGPETYRKQKQTHKREITFFVKCYNMWKILKWLFTRGSTRGLAWYLTCCKNTLQSVQCCLLYLPISKEVKHCPHLNLNGATAAMVTLPGSLPLRGLLEVWGEHFGLL